MKEIILIGIIRDKELYVKLILVNILKTKMRQNKTI